MKRIAILTVQSIEEMEQDYYGYDSKIDKWVYADCNSFVDIEDKEYYELAQAINWKNSENKKKHSQYRYAVIEEPFETPEKIEEFVGLTVREYQDAILKAKKKYEEDEKRKKERNEKIKLENKRKRLEKLKKELKEEKWTFLLHLKQMEKVYGAIK